MANCPLAVALLACALAAAPAAAQEDTLPARRHAVSVLPLHAAFGFYAAEYEGAVSETVTLGIAGSIFPTRDPADQLLNPSVDLKIRYYPSADALQGLSFGVAAGPTFLQENYGYDGRSEKRTVIGIGFELARSHILGRDQRFHYAYGGGFKRLLFVDPNAARETTLPTLRLSIGYAF